jgi:hypothetical protein
VRVQDLLIAAISLPENWSAQAPEGEPVVSLRSQPGATEVAAHPLGGLTFRQRVAPLDIALERYGAAAIEGDSRFVIDEVELGDEILTGSALEDVLDSFAPAQYFELSDAQKLARPSFESFTSGVSISFDEYEVDAVAAAQAAPLGYQLIIIDEEEDGSAPETLLLEPALAVALASSGPAAVAEIRRTGLRRFDAPAAGVKLEDRKFAVVTETDATSRPKATAGSYTGALEKKAALETVKQPLAVVGVRTAAK